MPEFYNHQEDPNSGFNPDFAPSGVRQPLPDFLPILPENCRQVLDIYDLASNIVEQRLSGEMNVLQARAGRFALIYRVHRQNRIPKQDLRHIFATVALDQPDLQAEPLPRLEEINVAYKAPPEIWVKPLKSTSSTSEQVHSERRKIFLKSCISLCALGPIIPVLPPELM